MALPSGSRVKLRTQPRFAWGYGVNGYLGERDPGTSHGLSGTASPWFGIFSVYISWNISVYIKVYAFGPKTRVTLITFYQQMFLEHLPCPRHCCRHLVVQSWSRVLKIRIKYKVMSTCEFCKEQKIRHWVSLGPRSLFGLSQEIVPVLLTIM